MSITIYTLNPITDFRVRPYTDIGATHTPSNQMSLMTCPDEYIAGTFVIRSTTAASNILPVASDLVGNLGGIIPASAIDLKIVKCWYQKGDCYCTVLSSNNCPGYGDNGSESDCGCSANPNMMCLLPELLLNDDAMVNVTINSLNSGTNLLKTYDSYPGTFHYDDVSTDKTNKTYTGVFVDVRDLPTLQPTSFGNTGGQYNNYNKQYWVTVHPPAGTPPDYYNGAIQMTINGTVYTVNLTVTILPFNLPKSMLSHGLYYTGHYDSGYPNGYIGCRFKSLTQLHNETTNMKKHGISEYRNIYLYSMSLNTAEITNALDNTVGWDLSTIMIFSYYSQYTGDLGAKIAQIRDYCHSMYGVTCIYFEEFNYDEQNVSPIADKIAIVRAQSTSYCACKTINGGGVNDYGIPNISLLDAFVLGGGSGSNDTDTMRKSLISQYHAQGKKVFQYNNPQAGSEEKPLKFRRNFGLYMWQMGYDGAYNFAYQYNYGHPYNDWNWQSGNSYKQHIMAYPTTDTVVDTVQWEGWREGINDVRYLTKLKNTITQAQSFGINTDDATSYVTSLQTMDFRTQDLDAIRNTIIQKTLDLLGQFPPVDDTASFTINVT